MANFGFIINVLIYIIFSIRRKNLGKIYINAYLNININKIA
jgi:hypothetical protein